MLNEDRIILMTRLASYESGEGKKNAAIGGYFRSDYIGMQVVKSVIYATIAFFILFGLYILYDFEVFMAEIYKSTLQSLPPSRRKTSGRPLQIQTNPSYKSLP